MSTRYDLMQVCEKGHKITEFGNSHPESLKNFCIQCGAKTISKCSACGTEIPGHEHSDNIGSAVEAPIPNNCGKCGSPFPWAISTQKPIGDAGSLSTTALLARAAKFITDITPDTKWILYAKMHNLEEIAYGIPKLYDSQRYKWSDYPEYVDLFFSKIANSDEKKARDFVKHVISKEVDLNDSKIISRDPILLQELGLVDIDSTPIELTQKKFINIQQLPDDFYIELQDQINRSFSYWIYPAVRILSRKFLENLIIDILRKKYGGQKVELYYNIKQRRFHGFETLLRNLESSISDFASVSPSLNSDLVKAINKFREQGNSSAHTIELNILKDDLEKESEELEHILKVLIRVHSLL